MKHLKTYEEGSDEIWNKLSKMTDKDSPEYLELLSKQLRADDEFDKYKYKYEFFKEAGISSSYYTSFFPIARTSIRMKIKRLIEDKIQYENRYAELERRSLEDLVLI